MPWKKGKAPIMKADKPRVYSNNASFDGNCEHLMSRKPSPKLQRFDRPGSYYMGDVRKKRMERQALAEKEEKLAKAREQLERENEPKPDKQGPGKKPDKKSSSK